MIQMIKKISEWIKRLFTKETLKLPENIKSEEMDNGAIQNMQFRDSIRTEASAEEKNLITKFEKGEISFANLTEDVRNKIINGYTLIINNNNNIIENNMKKIETIEG